MLCYDCKVKMRKIKTNYRYKESGLNNLILKGIPAYKCPKCNQINPIIKNIKELHQLVAQRLINKKSVLSGQELIFLRKEIGLKAKELAEKLGVHKVTISRWENEKEQISFPYDSLVKFIYVTQRIKEKCIMVRPDIEKLLPKIPEITQLQDFIKNSCSFLEKTEMDIKGIKHRPIQHKLISVPFDAFS